MGPLARICLPLAGVLLFLASPPALGQEKPSARNEADIGFIGLHGGVYEQLQGHAKTLKVRLTYFEDGEVSQKTADLSGVKVLYIQHTREEDRDAYRSLIEQARQKNPELKIIVFQASSGEFLRSLGVGEHLHTDAAAGRYYGSSSDNLRRLLGYTAVKYLGRDGKIEPPQEIDRDGLYHPDHAELFPSADAFLIWNRSRAKTASDQPRLLIAVHGTHLFFQQPRVVDALIREAEKQGAIAAAILDGRAKSYEDQAVAFGAHAMIHTCHSFDSSALRRQLDIPHLHSIFIRNQSIAQWQASVEGLSSSELGFHVIGQELIGGIEPQVTAGTTAGQGSDEAFQPIPERVEHLIRRALAQARLAQTPPQEKKVAIIYYDREMGKGELMRGSSTGMHMNGPRSLLRVLTKMQEHGYAIRPLPQHEDELLSWMTDRGRLIGVWAPAELDRLARRGAPLLIPAEKYQAWYEQKVPADRRRQVEERWGQAPGKFMVWENKGRKYLVLPRIELGNVILLPQPLRGEVHGKQEANSQSHDKASTPPHNYLATYFWLEQEFGADALVHFGTHGSEFALPGKPNGLAQRDWPDIIMGRMPNFNPWIIENMVESSPVRRRVYGTLISHLSPPIVDAGLSDELANLHDMIDKWSTLEEGALKARFRDEITQQVQQCHLDVDLKLVIPAEGLLADAEIQKASDYLHDIQEETTPTSLHVFGEPPRKDLLIPYLVNILRSPFLKAVEKLVHRQQHEKGIDHEHQPGHEHDVRPAAEQILQLVLHRGVSPKDAVSTVVGRDLEALPEEIEDGLKLAQKLNAEFQRTTDEVDNLLRGLDGKFVPPGPGNNPIRNPNAVPTGRNMYLLNPEEVPTRPSWELGKKLADELIARHQVEHGEFPTKVGFDLRSSATFRDYGVMEAQILHLMGVEPVWDERQLVSDVKLVSRDQLGRPRVDVFIAAGSWYESNLPSRLNLWDKAVRLATLADEPDNPLFANTRDLKAVLAAQGIAAERAALLSRGRIFGRAPGHESGGFLGYSVARSGDWNTRDDIAAEYLASHQYVFTEGAWGEEAAPLYNAAIQGTHTVVRSWSDHMTGPLASRYTWVHGGGLCLAVEAATGQRPQYVFSDVRDPDKAGIVDAEDALRKEFRVRLFNRKWLEGMMKEGYAGADHMRVMASNSFGWEVMRPGSVGNENWAEMKRVLVDDKLNLNLRDWFERNNPYAFQDATSVMLEAIRKGYWQADAETAQQLATEYARSVARHGLSGHITSGGNRRLDDLVRQELTGLPGTNAEELLARYSRRIDEQVQFTAADAAPAELASSPRVSQAATAADPPPAAAEVVIGKPPLPMVSGHKLEPVDLAPTDESEAIPLRYWLVGLVAVAIFVCGLILRRSA